MLWDIQTNEKEQEWEEGGGRSFFVFLTDLLKYWIKCINNQLGIGWIHLKYIRQVGHIDTMN